MELMLLVEHTGENDDGSYYSMGVTTQPISNTIFDGLGLTELRGALYRHSLKEYGRCKSKVFQDGRDGVSHQIGWYFERREPFDDVPEHFLHGVWVTLAQRVNGTLLPFCFDQPYRLEGC